MINIQHTGVRAADFVSDILCSLMFLQAVRNYDMII